MRTGMHAQRSAVRPADDRLAAVVIPPRAAATDDVSLLPRTSVDACVMIRPETLADPRDLPRLRDDTGRHRMMVLLVSPTIASIRAAISCIRTGPIAVLMERDLTAIDCGAWSDAIIDARSSCRIVTLMGLGLETAPPIIAANVLALFAGISGAQSMKVFAAQCDMSERHALRCLQAVGLCSSRRAFAAARVLRAYHAVASGSIKLGVVAVRYGFGSRRAMSSQWRGVTGEPVRATRGRSLSDAMIARIAQRLIIEHS